jgi:hypothetical protein
MKGLSLRAYFLNIYRFSRLFLLAYIAVAINFFLRGCTRFLAAMKLQLLPVFHPVFIVPPALCAFYYSICNFMAWCSINNWIGPFGLSLACLKDATGAGPIPDYYLLSIYMMLYLIWAFSTIRGASFSANDEM